MNERTAWARMWADLLAAENRARHAPHEVTRRAELYLHAGLPLEQVLDALKVSRATWYRRVEALREHEAKGRAAASVHDLDEKRRDRGPRYTAVQPPPLIGDIREVYSAEDPEGTGL